MQINIAVCDDDRELCAQLENLLIGILNELAVKFEIDLFNSGESLCKELKRSEYDLIFLDIELQQMNGVEIGKFIRETLKNEIIQIAFISSRKEYALKLFDFRPINFLVKPLDTAKIKKVIDKYMVISEQDNHMFAYKKGFEYYKIPMSDILYFHKNTRKVTVVTRNGSDEFYDSLENIYINVKGHNFLFIHKSIIVNYYYITKFGYEQVTMLDGAAFSISQSRRKNIRIEYMDIKKREE